MPESGPINFLAYSVLEVGGREATAQVEFSFRRVATPAGPAAERLAAAEDEDVASIPAGESNRARARFVE
jgi:hypothetical protein